MPQLSLSANTRPAALNVARGSPAGAAQAGSNANRAGDDHVHDVLLQAAFDAVRSGPPPASSRTRRRHWREQPGPTLTAMGMPRNHGLHHIPPAHPPPAPARTAGADQRPRPRLAIATSSASPERDDSTGVMRATARLPTAPERIRTSIVSRRARLRAQRQRARVTIRPTLQSAIRSTTRNRSRTSARGGTVNRLRTPAASTRS